MVIMLQELQVSITNGRDQFHDHVSFWSQILELGTTRVSTVELGTARVNKESSDIKELKEQIAGLKAALARKEEEQGRRPTSRSSTLERVRTGSHLLFLLVARVVPSTEYLHTVNDGGKNYTVCLLEKKCVCGRFQVDELPCPHAWTVLKSKFLMPEEYCSN
uniref:SWIM-type domain-containing protein n=1 Tax=Nicotiana tabacum TaxID=4097 RepID=A0A1S4BD02_TOBAC|nr:PREDICTED: uncharacterized protein LOC107806935 [Nicotiana tabacum]